MANITDQFVTSFSELYYSTTPIAGALGSDGKYEESDIRTWFNSETDDVEQSTAATVSTTAADAVIVLNGVTFTGDFDTDSATTATALALDINSNALYTAAASSAVVTITLTAGGASFTVVDGTSVTSVTTAFDAKTRLVPLVMEIGTLSNEATVIDTPTFGEAYRGKLRGQLDGGQLDAQLYWAPKDPTHSDLRDLAESGKQVFVGIKWKADGTDTADEEYVYFDSFVSSFGIDTTFDDVAKVSCTFVVDGAEHFAGSGA